MLDLTSGTYSPGAYVALIAAIVLGILLLLTVAGAVLAGDGELRVMSGMGAVVVLLIIGGAALSYYPFSSDFHKYYTVSGTVAETPDSRLISSGDSVSQRYVIKFAESGDLYGVDDTRAATVKQGDKVSLRCKREFEFNSVPGWGCKWNTK